MTNPLTAAICSPVYLAKRNLVARGMAVTKLRLLATTGDLMGIWVIGRLGGYTRLEPPGVSRYPQHSSEIHG